MLDTEIRTAVQEFVAALQAQPETMQYMQAQTEYSADPDLRQLRGQYTEVIQDFQRKQTEGTYTQTDVDAVRAIQAAVQDHPATTAVVKAEGAFRGVCSSCNDRITDVLGINFAQIAGAGCGCGGSCDC